MTANSTSFQKGQSGNPGGRPKAIAQVRELAQIQTEEAIHTLAAIMTSEKTNPAARVSAANALLDRGWGKPSQHMELSTNPLDEFDAKTLATVIELLEQVEEESESAEGTLDRDEQVH